MLDGAGLTEFIDFTLSNEDIERPKPDPEVYFAAFERLGVRPDECVVIEDSDVGKAAATASGARALLGQRPGRRQLLPRPAHDPRGRPRQRRHPRRRPGQALRRGRLPAPEAADRRRGPADDRPRARELPRRRAADRAAAGPPRRAVLRRLADQEPGARRRGRRRRRADRGRGLHRAARRAADRQRRTSSCSRTPTRSSTSRSRRSSRRCATATPTAASSPSSPTTRSGATRAPTPTGRVTRGRREGRDLRPGDGRHLLLPPRLGLRPLREADDREGHPRQRRVLRLPGLQPARPGRARRLRQRDRAGPDARARDAGGSRDVRGLAQRCRASRPRPRTGRDDDRRQHPARRRRRGGDARAARRARRGAPDRAARARGRRGRRARALRAGSPRAFVVHPRRGDAGRRDALALAATIALAARSASRSRRSRAPSPGFVDPLVEAVRAGAGLAAPVLETCGGDVHGYRAAADGSLWPLARRAKASRTRSRSTASPPRASSGSPACPSSTRSRATTSCTSRARPGSLAVVPEARCRRRTIGPPASVIVCTQDRPDEIVPCAEALLAAGADEILVVDNGSGAPLDLPDGVKLVREPVAGLSRARNTGAEAATHDVLVYLDDDARPAPGWLEHLRDAFADDASWSPAARSTACGPGSAHPAGRRPRGRATSRSSRTATPTRRGRAATSTARTGPSAARRSTRSAASSTAGARPATACSPARRPRSSSSIAACGCGVARYSAGAAVGHRIDPGRCDEGWLALRVYRHGLAHAVDRGRLHRAVAGARRAARPRRRSSG